MEAPYDGIFPRIGQNVFIAPDAWVIGDVELADNVSIFFGAVLRGDILPIKVGARSNIQEHSVVHTSRRRTPTIIGEDVTVGHRATLHGAHICDRCIVGMGAIVLDEAVVEEECLIAAGAVITEGKRIPARSLVIGIPARVIRPLDEKEIAYIKESAERYTTVGAKYLDIFSNQ